MAWQRKQGLLLAGDGIPQATILLTNEGGRTMLILTRRVSEALIIGDDITITVLSIKGHQVRLGINAPKKVPVHREEIYQRIQMEKLDKSVEESLEEY